MAYIEPCCCDRQLPKLLREQPTVFFQTNGDVTIQKFMNAVGCMAGSKSELWLMVPQVDISLLRVLRHWFKMEWIASLKLLTQENQAELVMGELGESDVWRQSVNYASDPMVIDGLMVFVGEKDVVGIQGAMLTRVDFSLSMYAATYGPKEKMLEAENGKVRAMIEPMRAKLNVKAKKA